MDRCIKCECEIKDEYFEGINGKICVNCIKRMFIYYALKSMGFIKTVRENKDENI